MVASRGNPKLLRFAFEYAKSQQAEVWVVFVRYIAVAVGPARPTDVAADDEAQRLNQQAEQLAAEFGVPWRFGSSNVYSMIRTTTPPSSRTR